MLFLLRNLLYNRVLLLDVPKDTILERLTLRSTDPQTGERLEIYEICQILKPGLDHQSFCDHSRNFALV
jgi:hypothetical protein